MDKPASDNRVHKGRGNYHSIDLVGQRFGRLLVLSEHPKRLGRRIAWMCQCDCGNTKVIRGHDLRGRKTHSCGCLLRETSSKRMFVHGYRVGGQRSRTYSAWYNMKQRCENPKHHRFSDWGGRGVIVCPEWSKSFELFRADMGECPSGMELDRIDNSHGIYCLFNCRWVTEKIQARNRRTNHLITHSGKTHCIQEWAEKLHISDDLLRGRLRAGWSIEKAFTEPVQAGHRRAIHA